MTEDKPFHALNPEEEHVVIHYFIGERKVRRRIVNSSNLQEEIQLIESRYSKRPGFKLISTANKFEKVG